MSYLQFSPQISYDMAWLQIKSLCICIIISGKTDTYVSIYYISLLTFIT
jgi:hypothetical protein